MSDIFQPHDEISITAENFKIDHGDHTHINSRLNYLSEVAPLGSLITLNLAQKNEKYIGSLEVKNNRVGFCLLEESTSVMELFSILDSKIHQEISIWKKNRFNNISEDKFATEAIDINMPNIKD